MVKRNIPNIDFNLLKECCDELGIELVPSICDNHVVLIDEDGNKDYLNRDYNIFHSNLKIAENNIL